MRIPVLFLTLVSFAAAAQPAPETAVGPPAVERAQAAGYTILRFSAEPGTTTREVGAVLEPLLRSAGVRGPYAYEWAAADIAGSGVPEIVALVRGADPELNRGPGEGHRLLVFSKAGGKWRFVLSGRAQAVGVRHREIAAIGPDGWRTYVWNGRVFMPVAGGKAPVRHR